MKGTVRKVGPLQCRMYFVASDLSSRLTTWRDGTSAIWHRHHRRSAVGGEDVLVMAIKRAREVALFIPIWEVPAMVSWNCSDYNHGWR